MLTMCTRALNDTMMDPQSDVRKLIADFVRDNTEVPQLKFIAENPGGITITEQAGLVNHTYRVTSKDGNHSVIIKHGKECIKGISTDRITLDRQVLEYNCLGLMESIFPGSAPKPYCLDRTHNIIAMEDLSDWELFMKPHRTGNVDLDVAANLGHLLSNMHQLTSKSGITTERWQELSIFRQDEMKSTMAKYLWEIPYNEHDKINKIPAQAIESYRKYVRELVSLGYVTKMAELYWEEKCFIHADCHWESIFVKDGKAKLFDFEFGYLSHPAQNVGFILMNYYFCYILAKGKSGGEGETVHPGTVDVYLQNHSGISEDDTKQFLNQTALFAGGILFAKSIFGPHEDLDYCTEPVNLQLFHTGFRMMRTHMDVESIDGLLGCLFKE